MLFAYKIHQWMSSKPTPLTPIPTIRVFLQRDYRPSSFPSPPGIIPLYHVVVAFCSRCSCGGWPRGVIVRNAAAAAADELVAKLSRIPACPKIAKERWKRRSTKPLTPSCTRHLPSSLTLLRIICKPGILWTKLLHLWQCHQDLGLIDLSSVHIRLSRWQRPLRSGKHLLVINLGSLWRQHGRRREMREEMMLPLKIRL